MVRIRQNIEEEIAQTAYVNFAISNTILAAVLAAWVTEGGQAPKVLAGFDVLKLASVPDRRWFAYELYSETTLEHCQV